MELKSLADGVAASSDGWVPQTQTRDTSTLFLPCIMRYAAKPFSRLSTTNHRQSQQPNSRHSDPIVLIHHTQSRIARDSASGPCKIFTPLGLLPSHLHIVGRRMRGLDLGMLVGLQLGPKHWSALSLQPPNSAYCAAYCREPLSATATALWTTWEVFIFNYFFRISGSQDQDRAELPAGTMFSCFVPSLSLLDHSNCHVWCAPPGVCGSLGWSFCLFPRWISFCFIPFSAQSLSLSNFPVQLIRKKKINLTCPHPAVKCTYHGSSHPYPIDPSHTSLTYTDP